MNNKTILKKAIEKAVKNGFIIDIFLNDDDYWKHCAKEKLYFNILCRHDFAKAFWGEDEKAIILTKIYSYKGQEKKVGGQHECLPAWQFHLREMVSEEEPLKYIEKFL